MAVIEVAWVMESAITASAAKVGSGAPFASKRAAMPRSPSLPATSSLPSDITSNDSQDIGSPPADMTVWIPALPNAASGNPSTVTPAIAQLSSIAVVTR